MTRDRELLSQFINISFIAPLITIIISSLLLALLQHLSWATGGSPQPTLTIPKSSRFFNPFQQFLQPKQWVRTSCHHFIFYFYYSTAQPLIVSDGYNDLWCSKSLFTCGWQWEDGSAEGREWYRWVWRSRNPLHFNVILKNTISSAPPSLNQLTAWGIR